VGVPLSVELDEIVAEEPAKEGLRHTRRKQPQHVRRRKRNVPEVVDENTRRQSSQLRWYEREVIILHPYLRGAGRAQRLLV
jgi:fido (protein-threonine AMPylation protein)